MAMPASSTTSRALLHRFPHCFSRPSFLWCSSVYLLSIQGSNSNQCVAWAPPTAFQATATRGAFGISSSSRRTTRCLASSSGNSKNMTTTTTSVNDISSVATGGDFAGLLATFTPSSGNTIPIPEYLIPPALLEWGQVPSNLEVLISEEVDGTTDTNCCWSRQIVTVYPAVGCGVDNLETSVGKETWQTLLREDTVRVAVVAATATDTATSNRMYKLEACFGWSPHENGQALTDNYRVSMQVTVTVDAGSDTPTTTTITPIVQSPVTIRLERQTSQASSDGTIANGGVLDGRTVSTLLGETLRKHQSTFGVPKEVTAEDTTDTLVHFPGNVTLGIMKDGVVQLGHSTLSNMRHVVQCRFGVDVDALPVVETWVEREGVRM